VIDSTPEFEVTLGAHYLPEREYLLNVLLGEFLGQKFRSKRGAGDDVVISLEGRSLRLPQTLLRGGDGNGHGRRQPPRQIHGFDVAEAGFAQAAFGSRTVPILYGDSGSDGSWITQEEDEITLHADVLGSSFFLLSRLEEVGSDTRDEFGLYPARASLAWSHGFLGRPVVDEYVEILWELIEALWPGVRRRQTQFSVWVSHDVDRPRAFDYPGIRDRLFSVRQHARSGTLPRLYGSCALNAIAGVLGLPHRDPFDNFDWLMDTDEGQGLRATYYFLCGGDTSLDGRYDVGSSEIRSLLRCLVNRGHEIGVHGSYATMEDASMLGAERNRLAQILRCEGLPDHVASVRQHYLRWRAPVTWRVAEEAGMDVDSSVGFNEVVGFRSGTSFEHPVFDVEHRRELRLRERPLHLMDRGLRDFDQEQALSKIDDLRREVARHGGTLGVLWHNNTFTESSQELARYQRAIAGA